jgi:uncharacterized protein (DUF433 family)
MAMPSKTSHPHVVKDPGVCGGRAVIAGTRVPVWSIVGYYRMGMDVDEILRALPHLTAAQVHDALSYFHDDPQEIEADLRANQATPPA